MENKREHCLILIERDKVKSLRFLFIKKDIIGPELHEILAKQQRMFAESHFLSTALFFHMTAIIWNDRRNKYSTNGNFGSLQSADYRIAKTASSMEENIDIF
jgi:hypothetical protein